MFLAKKTLTYRVISQNDDCTKQSSEFYHPETCTAGIV